MRMRFKPYARPELLACDFHVHEPLTHGGHWHETYARPDQPWHLELGCGKGGFLAQLAPQHPDINYLGIDITDKVLILAKRKVEAAYAERGLTPDNVKIASIDIERLGNAFTPAVRVDRIYINFCNPWRKNAGSDLRTEHEGMFTEMGIPIKALIARKGPDSTVTWVEPKALAKELEAEDESEAAREDAE